MLIYLLFCFTTEAKDAIISRACARTLAVMKPDGMANIAQILDEIWQSGFEVPRLRSMRLKLSEAREFYKDERAQPDFK